MNGFRLPPSSKYANAKHKKHEKGAQTGFCSKRAIEKRINVKTDVKKT